MKNICFAVIFILVLFLLASCPSSSVDPIPNPNSLVNEPDYYIPIVWESNMQRPFCNLVAADETGIYVYSYKQNEFTTVRLNKINHETGATLWTTDYFGDVNLDPPIIADGYIYVLLYDDAILCFDKGNGNLLARIKINFSNQNTWVKSGYWYHDNCFYFGYGDSVAGDQYLGRINISSVSKDGSNLTEQLLIPDALWQSRNKSRILARPFVHNNIVYCNTITLDINLPVEMAGIDINTKAEVFYESFGGDGKNNFDHGGVRYPFYEKDSILYYFGESIAAYDTTDNSKKYHVIFGLDTPEKSNYGAGGSLGAIFYKNNIYYTTNGGNAAGGTDIRNIFCVNRENGALVWSAIARKSESLGTKPIIYDNKVFIPHMGGMRVYDADSGKLIGVDKRYEFGSLCINQLYGSIMITAKYSVAHGGLHIAAFDLKK